MRARPGCGPLAAYRTSVPDAATLALFSLAALALIVVPGPAVLYIVARSVDQGRRAGVVSALGIAVGGLVHVAAATIGISSLVVSSAHAFEVVKYAGAAYLIVLGIRRLLTHEEAAEDVRAGTPLRSVFTQGVIVNVLNPKTALFFLAFLPQFVDPEAGSVALQTVTLGFVFIALALASDSAYGMAAGTLGGAFRRHSGFLRVQRYVSGSVFVGLGLATAVSGSKAKS
jgi:threonine/homoserine/homoserine lactone efflux protein